MEFSASRMFVGKKYEEVNIDSEMEIGSGSKCFKEKYKW